MRYSYNTQFTCSRRIELDINDGVITNVQFIGGCNGNLKGVSALVDGMTVDQITAKCEGITCGYKPTSCPDQLARACKAARAEELRRKGEA